MGIFGEKCERCGQRTRHKSEDKPVCESCEAEMALLLEATQEKALACPLDGAKMTKAIVHMVLVDRCPKCQGVWLDGDELEKLYSSASNEALVQVTRGLWTPLG